MRKEIAEIIKTDRRLHADFFCWVYLKGGNERLVIGPKTLEGIGELNADLDLDIYWEARRIWRLAARSFSSPS